VLLWPKRSEQTWPPRDSILQWVGVSTTSGRTYLLPREPRAPGTFVNEKMWREKEANREQGVPGRVPRQAAAASGAALGASGPETVVILSSGRRPARPARIPAPWDVEMCGS